MDTFVAKKAGGAYMRVTKRASRLVAPTTWWIARRRGVSPQQVEGAAVPAKRSPSQVTTSGADAVRTPKWSTPS